MKNLLFDRDLEVGGSIPRRTKSVCMAANLSRCVLVVSICIVALYRLDRRHGSFTDLMCFDSVIDEHKPFGAPNARTS